MTGFATTLMSLSLPAVFALVLLWSVVPSLVTRMSVACYPRGDARGRDLLERLYARERADQLFWALQQFERAFTEGLVPRVIQWSRRR